VHTSLTKNIVVTAADRAMSDVTMPGSTYG
jgi:hypothetical protein